MYANLRRDLDGMDKMIVLPSQKCLPTCRYYNKISSFYARATKILIPTKTTNSV